MYSPKFTITSQVANALVEIEKQKQKIDGAKILPQQVVRLRHRATVDEIHSSTSIEGNQLNRNQVEQVVSGKLNSKEYAVIEVSNYKKALELINKQSISQISSDIILRLHDLVTKDLLPSNKVGQFRKGPIYIVDIEDGKEIIRYEGPAASSINKYLNELFVWLNKKNELHPIIKAAILHYEFVSIHPFSDGNGRVTRLLIKLFLKLQKYFFRGALSLDSYYLENRLRYYEELNLGLDYQSQRLSDLTSWIEFFVVGFEASVEKLAREVITLSVVDETSSIDFSEDDIEIIDYASNFGSITSNDVQEILRVGERTAQRRLKKLLEAKILIQKGVARNIRYELRK